MMLEDLEGGGLCSVGWRKENRLDGGSEGRLEWAESKGEGKAACKFSQQMDLQFICGWGGRLEEECVNHGSFL